MPRAVPESVRQALWQAHRQGLGTTALAHRFALPARTVRHLLRQARLTQGPLPSPAYRTAAAGPKSSQELVGQVRRCRELHPGWGTDWIRVVLADLNPGVALPSGRTLRRWLEQAGLSPAPAGCRPEGPPRPDAVHEGWQLDAADQMPLATGQPVSWLRIAEECSGAVLDTAVFPLGV